MPFYYELRWFYDGNHFCSTRIISESCPIVTTEERSFPQKPSASSSTNSANVSLVRVRAKRKVNPDGLKTLKFSS
jgi:hypothetical protein